MRNLQSSPDSELMSSGAAYDARRFQNGVKLPHVPHVPQTEVKTIDPVMNGDTCYRYSAAFAPGLRAMRRSKLQVPGMLSWVASLARWSHMTDFIQRALSWERFQTDLPNDFEK